MTVAPGSKKTYAQVMTTGREKISLQEAGISDLRVRRSIAGGLILETPGENNAEMANKLASRLREVFDKDEEVRISRPYRKAEIRINGLDDSVTPAKVASAVSAAGECNISEVKIGEIRRRSLASIGSIWVQCPATAACKIAATGRLKVGWVSPRVDILPPRPLQCFRCLESGHAMLQCNTGPASTVAVDVSTVGKRGT